ncbi:hypothetical protein Sa4125_47860 (plasmid) [Aureimonas sp. SA4125]|nr:hypothetical protein Sa4125_47860 [Aureimonas sp. SA4125]
MEQNPQGGMPFGLRAMTRHQPRPIASRSLINVTSDGLPSRNANPGKMHVLLLTESARTGKRSRRRFDAIGVPA